MYTCSLYKLKLTYIKDEKPKVDKDAEVCAQCYVMVTSLRACVQYTRGSTFPAAFAVWVGLHGSIILYALILCNTTTLLRC